MSRSERLSQSEARRSCDEVEIGFGIGFEPETVLYGNIGIPSRLEFTVIGRVANEAARIESQCRRLIAATCLRNIAPAIIPAALPSVDLPRT